MTNEMIFNKLNKTNLNKMFLKNSNELHTFIITNNNSELEIILELNVNEKEKLINKLFSQEIFEFLNKFDENVLIFCCETNNCIEISFNDYCKFYNSNDKIKSLYEIKEKIKEKLIINVKIGIQRQNSSEIEDIVECEAEKKPILDFINKIIRNYSIKYFFEKTTQIVININNSNWKTMNQLIEDGIAVIK